MSLKLPNLVIIGVHKSATTSLFMYLKAHPEVFGASKKEIHFFTPLRYNNQLQPLEEYALYFKGYSNEKYALEASPSYFYGKEVIINAMQETLGKHKVILILREPTARFVSFYKHLKSKLMISEDETMDAFIDKSLQYIGKPIEENNPYSRAVQEGFYINYINPWINCYGDDLKIVYFEDLKRNTKSLMINMAEWLNIDANFFEKMDYIVENKTVFAKNKILHKTALWLNESFEKILRKNSGIKAKLRKLYYSFNAAKQQETIDELQVKKLKIVYDKPDKQLQELLTVKNLNTPSW